MIPVDEARALVRERARPVAGAETVPLAEAGGRVLAEPVRADRDDPPFDRAQMDGYAVRSADPPGPRRVVGSVAAGDARLPEVGAGCAAWINTGAALPPGADAVVAVEDAGPDGAVLAPVEPGANVLRRGALARALETVAEGILTPERVGVCASAGAHEVRVRRRPRVAVLATGTELRESPGAHEIRNSNGPTLVALLDGCEVRDLGAVVDDRDALAAALDRGLAADVLVTTGGVSRGDKDLVRPLLEAAGVEVVFHGVALQPGKPVLFGTRGGCAVFALPGNPASAVVCADLFLLPYVAAAAGRGFDDALLEARGRLAAPVKASHKRRRVFPCVRRGSEVHPLPWRSSADLHTLARGNAYMVVEIGQDLRKGDEVRALVPERFAASALRP